MAFPVPPELVRAAERKLGRVFPPEYFVSICELNGGSVRDVRGEDWELFSIFDATDRRRLRATCQDVCRETERLRQLGWFPDGVVAIGTNGGGDAIVLLPSEDGRSFLPEIYCWRLDEPELDVVADDFAGLIRTHKPPPSGH